MKGDSLPKNGSGESLKNASRLRFILSRISRKLWSKSGNSARGSGAAFVLLLGLDAILCACTFPLRQNWNQPRNIQNFRDFCASIASIEVTRKFAKSTNSCHTWLWLFKSCKLPDISRKCQLCRNFWRQNGEISGTKLSWGNLGFEAWLSFEF